ncbi:hypothetical protein [Longimicrobium sp.]|uniref:hypothetical protein n=1 Tax=Longimicrobium sp. TaxID=2029185 RepID=UPI003B3AEAEC
MTAAPASDAEARACATAARYAGRWASGFARPALGDDDDRPDPPPVWFVDGFAGADLQRAALRGTTIQPAAVLATQALDDAGARARIVLIEEDPGLLARLGELLDDAGAGERVRASSDPASAGPGEILLVEAPFASHAHHLAQQIGDEPALVCLAPLAARTLPWSALEPVMDLGGADVLLRFPREDFEKQARFTGPMADLPPHLRRVVEGCSGFLGDARHGWLIAWREAQRSRGPEAALATAITRMQALLAPAGGDRVAYALRVGGTTESVDLLLSTPAAEHLPELDAALADAGTKQKPASRRKPARSAKPGAQPATEPAAAPPATPAPEASAEPPAEPAVADARPIAEPEPVTGTRADAGATEVRTTETGLVPEPPVAPEEASARVQEPAMEPADSASPAEPEPAETSTAEPPDAQFIAEAPEPVAEPAADPAARATKPRSKTPAPDASRKPAVTPVATDEPAAALDLFALAPQPEPEPRGPDLGAFADDLHARHIGARVPAADLLASGVDAGLTPEQVRSALTSLKRTGRVSYKSLDAEGAEVEFLTEARVSAPRPRKPRAPIPGVLGLFDEPEE